MILRNALLALTFLSLASSAPGQGARLLKHPSISESSIVFTNANDVWVVNREGGNTDTLVYEFGHGLGFIHKCGNWDYRSNDTNGNACTMHYASWY